MPVITSDFCFRIDSFEQLRCRLVIRVLRNELAVNCQVKDFAFGLLNDCLQISLAVFYLVY